MKNSRIDIRIPKNLKEMAQAKAKDEKTTVTEVITRMLVEWIKNTKL